jgi:FixJ family two-component response regulator
MQALDTIVYVVNDDPTEVMDLTRFLTSSGLRVITFTSAADYIASRNDDRIACLILDLNLPDANGLEVQTRLAENGSPPIIFVTEAADILSGVSAMKNGAIDFITTPVDYDRLMAAVRIAFAQDQKRRRERVEHLSLLSRWDSLTPREAEVFHCTVAGLLNKQGAAELGIVENTYQVHRGRVMRKMQANSLADLVRMSTRLELIFPIELGKGNWSVALRNTEEGWTNRSAVG